MWSDGLLRIFDPNKLAALADVEPGGERTRPLI
jgi:hypothetical protein